jgi:hypothetical protein
MLMLEGLRPTSGNLAPEESWRRMLGGRQRYNHERQQKAKARRDAILIWLMENRMYLPTKRLGYLGTDYIVARHGDGALLAKALGVGKATVCRDLSALQATRLALFGKPNIEANYEEYMTFWRYAHRTGLGNEQPGHNLRFPRAQRGPEARTRRNVVKALGHDVYQTSIKPDHASDDRDGGPQRAARSYPDGRGFPRHSRQELPTAIPTRALPSQSTPPPHHGHRLAAAARRSEFFAAGQPDTSVMVPG